MNRTMQIPPTLACTLVRSRNSSFPRARRRNSRISVAAPILSLIAIFLLCISSVWPLGAQAQPAHDSAEHKQIQDLIAQHRFHEARTETIDVISAHPSDIEAYNLLGMIESQLRDYAGAVAILQKALKIAPNSTKTRVNLGNLYASQKQFDLAEKEFRAVLRIDPANRDAHYNLGMLLVARGSPAQAIPHFLRVRPQTTESRFNLVRAYFLTKQAKEALRVAAELSADPKSDVQAHFSLGVLLASEKDYSEAVVEFEKADALTPDTFEIVYNLGQALLRTGKFAEASLALNRALRLKPDSPDALYLLAQISVQQSRPLDALDLLVRAHRLTPQNLDVTFLMAQVSMSQNYYEDAIPLLESGLQIAPRRPDFLAALGESYFMSGKIDKSLDEFKQLLEVEGSARSYAYVGLSYRNLGRFGEAKTYFQQGLKLDPHNSTCLFNLGFIAERQGEAASAETFFQQALQYNPGYSDAILELANLRIAAGKLEDGVDLLKKYVQVSHDPAAGYYKLAMAERSLHRSADSERDLNVFKTLSKNTSSGPYPFEHLFDYLDSRSKLAPGARAELDLAELTEEVKKHPGQPENLYLLAEAYFKAGETENARSTVAQLDQLASGDYRTLTGIGVLLARYRLYDDAIEHFKAAITANPDSADVKFDLANAYFRKHLYSDALDTLKPVSDQCGNDEACLSLLGDIYSHQGDKDRAAAIFRDAIKRNPDSDQGYLSLAMLDLNQNDLAGAKQILSAGQARIPGSGKLFWAMGLTSALEGNTTQAAAQFERAVDLLPEWPGGYSLLGVFYFQTGQIAKAREVLSRFKSSSASGSLDIGRIEQVLDQAPQAAPAPDAPMSQASRAQLLQLAVSLADRTL
jgi:tetratricopeptide (TPR) repeat protein